MDVLDLMTALGAAVSGTVPVVVILLWMIWREVRKSDGQREREGRKRRNGGSGPGGA